jgi:hypothetical protein
MKVGDKVKITFIERAFWYVTRYGIINAIDVSDYGTKDYWVNGMIYWEANMNNITKEEEDLYF